MQIVTVMVLLGVSLNTRYCFSLHARSTDVELFVGIWIHSMFPTKLLLAPL